MDRFICDEIGCQLHQWVSWRRQSPSWQMTGKLCSSAQPSTESCQWRKTAVQPKLEFPLAAHWTEQSGVTGRLLACCKFSPPQVEEIASFRFSNMSPSFKSLRRIDWLLIFRCRINGKNWAIIKVSTVYVYTWRQLLHVRFDISFCHKFVFTSW